MSRRHLGVTPGQSFATPLCHRAPKDSDAYEVDVSELFHGLGWHGDDAPCLPNCRILSTGKCARETRAALRALEEEDPS